MSAVKGRRSVAHPEPGSERASRVARGRPRRIEARGADSRQTRRRAPYPPQGRLAGDRRRRMGGRDLAHRTRPRRRLEAAHAPAAALEVQHRAPLLIERINALSRPAGGDPPAPRPGPSAASAAGAPAACADACRRRGGADRGAAARYRRSRTARRSGPARPSRDRRRGLSCGGDVAPEPGSRYHQHVVKGAHDAENVGSGFGYGRADDALFAVPRRPRIRPQPGRRGEPVGDRQERSHPGQPRRPDHDCRIRLADLSALRPFHRRDPAADQKEVDRHRQSQAGAARLSARRRGVAGGDDRALRPARQVLCLYRHLFRRSGQMGTGLRFSGGARPGWPSSAG